MARQVIALAGNPNTGKSTLFNRLTGLKQHTGNWPGKTVGVARGDVVIDDENFVVVDLPGTYSLLANSAEEEVARDFLWLAKPGVTIVVTDATNLERNLNLVLQVIEITPRTVVCVNLIDEARRSGLSVNTSRLGDLLGVPAVATSARTGEGVSRLMETVARVARQELVPEPVFVVYDDKVEQALEPIRRQLVEWGLDKREARWIALRLLEGDQTVLGVLERYIKGEEPDVYEVAAAQSAD